MPSHWQFQTRADLVRLLAPDHAVCALLVIGSGADPDTLDDWSDLDVVLIVTDADLPRFHPSTDWLRPLGEPYACAASSEQAFVTQRVYFTDGRRIDVVVVPESRLREAPEQMAALLAGGSRLLFCRDPRLEGELTGPVERPPVPADVSGTVTRMASDFRFKGMLAVSKVARNDLLVALHLSLDMTRDCCVLAMLLRDREAGTTHHREGGAGAPYLARLRQIDHPATASGILDRVQQCARVFDELAARLAAEHQPRHEPLLRWIERARAATGRSA